MATFSKSTVPAIIKSMKSATCRSNVGFRPQRSRFKIYIIDEVHMLSTSAFNALLKTLEEPPAHVKFIFATTEVHKIPITILSRCQRFDFANISADRVFDTLKAIVQGEKFQADDEALAIVSQRSGGSMRRCPNVARSTARFQRWPVDRAAKVHSLLGTASDDVLMQLADAVIDQSGSTLINLATSFFAQGHQPTELLDQVIDYWRGLMLAHVMGNGQHAQHLSQTIRAKLNTQMSRISLDTVLAGIGRSHDRKSENAHQFAHADSLGSGLGASLSPGKYARRERFGAADSTRRRGCRWP